ncbi:ubiquinol-cytochrome c reductase complex 14 kDa protein [Rutstroemia sp. NJR-2017a BBW]|nr:ubiquinol-cytochrome c reductase complex 14 kDa protein [Rutstroemia sp. NJR-2017a BBW]
MSAPSLAPFIKKTPWLHKMLKPVAHWYINAAGYRQLGLRFVEKAFFPPAQLDCLCGVSREGEEELTADDLIPEESEIVLLAISRLEKKEAYDRVFRMRRAMQCSLSHTLLPKEEQTKPEEDYPYLSPIIAEIQAEHKERADLESLTILKK